MTKSTHTEHVALEPEAAIRLGSCMRRGLGYQFDICMRRARERQPLTEPGRREKHSRELSCPVVDGLEVGSSAEPVDTAVDGQDPEG